MELKYLYTVKKVIETGSYQNAAAALSYAQSTITFQMKQLENELGVKLFEKNGSKMELTQGGKEKKASGIMPLIQKSLCDKSYRCLLIGFFTCGFHMAIIETHLFSQMVSCGIAENIAAMAFSIYGFSSVAGSLASGFFCSKVKMKWVVSALYGSRAVWIGLFLLLPKNIPTFIAFSSVLGLTGASTVTPTSGIVGKLFGAESIATLFGIVFVSHQTGSFFSAWLGGICAEATGSYIPIWCIGALLSVAAMFVSCLIKEPE